MTTPTSNLSKLKLEIDTRLKMRVDGQATGEVWASKFLKSTAAFVAISGLGVAGFAVSAPNLDDVAQALATKSEIDFRIGRNANSGRVEIYGSMGARASVRNEKGEVIIRLPGQKTPDIGDFRANPPTGVKAITLRKDSRASEIVLTLDDDAKARFGRSDGAVFVQIETKAAAETAGRKLIEAVLNEKEASVSAGETPQAAEVVPQQIDVLDVKLTQFEEGAQLDFTFAASAGAAVFRRGEAIWIVFDKEVDLKLPEALKDLKLIDQANWARNDGFTALRLISPSSGKITVLSDGPTWRVRLGATPLEAVVSEVAIQRDDTTGSPAITFNMPGARKVAWIRDPMVGDRMAVVTAPGPIKAVLNDRSTLQASLGNTLQGAFIERMAPDVSVTIEGDRVSVTRPDGLWLSSPETWAGVTRQSGDLLGPALHPSMVDMDNWSKLRPEGYLRQVNALQLKAADEAGLGPEGPYAARLNLARFLVGQGLNFEAQGVLEWLGKSSPRAMDDPQIRGLLAVAKIYSGRLSEALPDLSSSALAVDPAANLWRGYIASRQGRDEDARKAFNLGAKTLEVFPAEWRARFATSNAQSALRLKDLKAASELISYAVTQDIAPLDKLEAQLVQAEIIEAEGDKRRAFNVYRAISKASADRINTPAQLRAARLKLELGEAKPNDVLPQMAALRFRWRGDETEMEIVRTMGDIYLGQGRYREALDVFKAAGESFARQPDALEINQKLTEAFRSLFLEGKADGLQPIEALALFYDFRDVTPPGADGDEMVRRLARRLVEVDLLSQAADLLQYQVDNRLQGVAKSSVAADLAAIHLMNRQPEKALQALWKTRTTLLPKPILAERRVLEARALNELNRTDNALEVLGADMSQEALDVRAEIFWRLQDWPKAAALLERSLGERWKKEGNLSLFEETNLVRAGVAYSLASDQAALDRLTLRYMKFAANAQNPEAVKVALAGLDNGPLNAADFTQAAAQTDSFTSWIAAMKQKFRQTPKLPLPSQGLPQLPPQLPAQASKPSPRAA
jgi:tetratricopeptide (TPR) repeat protein